MEQKKMHQRALAEINLTHLTHNLRAVRRRLPEGCKMMAVVKADAYGHGAPEIAGVLAQNGVEAFSVATCEEGVQLRECGINAPVLVMGFTPQPLFPTVLRHKLTQTVYSVETAKALSEAAARFNTRAEIHIIIDTGMGWLGFLPEPASVDAICEIAALPALNVTGMFTHFATSDALDNAFMPEQQRRFGWLCGQLVERGLCIPNRHSFNSGAFAQTLRGAEYGGGFPDTVRLGILLYGLPPSSEMKEICGELRLKPVMRLLAQVGMVKTLPAGFGISYGHSFRTQRETRVATLHIGYADGYPRRLSNKARALINGQYAPIVGAICMDQCMADVTGIPVNPGDVAVMLGAEENSADVLADTLGTIGYEVVCGIGKRVPRVYINANDGNN
jgi:alanine racemase